MHRRPSAVPCGFLLSALSLSLLAACGPPAASLSCGSGTSAVEGVCRPDTVAPPCGTGTVASDGVCVVAPLPELPDLTSVRMTLLQVGYDLSQPVYLNNSLPVHFGVTATGPAASDGGLPVSRTVNVSFSFVQAGGGSDAGTCSSNGVDVTLVGDGTEQQFDLDLFPTTDCAEWIGAGAVANLAVDFDLGLRLADAGVRTDEPSVVFSAASQASATNQRCRSEANPDAGAASRGCVYALSLEPTPLGPDGGTLIDARLESLTPESSVVVVWPTASHPDTTDGGNESDPASLVVSAVLVLEGRDPYQNAVDLSQVSQDLVQGLRFGLSDAGLAALDELPGDAVVQYDLVPTSRVAPGAWMPLTIDDPAALPADVHVRFLHVGQLKAGAANTFNHLLYIEGATHDVLTGAGAWAGETSFTVRGCLISSFSEGGNAGEPGLVNSPIGGDIPGANCLTFQVALVRAAPQTTSSSAYTFNNTWQQSVGKASSLQGVGTLTSTNTLDMNGAHSDTEGTADLNGKLGKSFTLHLFQAWARAGALTVQAQSFVDVGVTAFGINLYGYQQTLNTISYEYNNWSIEKEAEIPALSYGFGPVSVSIKIGVGGEFAVTPRFTVSAQTGGEPTVPALANAVSNGLLQASVEPSVALKGSVSGGIDLWFASAEVVMDVTVVEVGFPIAANLRWGVTRVDGNQRATQLTVLGQVTWDMELTWLGVEVDLVGKLFGWHKTFNIWTYSNPPSTYSLIDRTIGAPLVLN